jgi:hypothetical protein
LPSTIWAVPPLDGDHIPDLLAVAVPGYRNVLAQKSFGAQDVDGAADGCVDTGNRFRMSETLGQNTHPQPGGRPGQLVGERRFRAVGTLPGIQAVGSGDRVENQRCIGNRAGHGTEVVEGLLDGKCAGVGDQPVGRFVSDDPGERGRQAHRAALVTTDGQVDGPGGDQSGTAAGGSAGGAGVVPGIAHRAGGGGVRRSGEAEVFADRLPGDGGAGGQQPGDHGGVPIRDVAFDQR